MASLIPLRLDQGLAGRLGSIYASKTSRGLAAISRVTLAAIRFVFMCFSSCSDDSSALAVATTSSTLPNTTERYGSGRYALRQAYPARLTFQGERLRPAHNPPEYTAEELAEVRSTAKLGCGHSH